MGRDKYRKLAWAKSHGACRVLPKEIGLRKWERSQTLRVYVQRTGNKWHMLKKMTLIIVFRVVWGGSDGRWVKSYCNNQGRVDKHLFQDFGLDVVFSLCCLLPAEGSWVQTWVGKFETGYGLSVLIFRVEPLAPVSVCTLPTSTSVLGGVWN